MTNHPNRNASTRIRWSKTRWVKTCWTAIWPDNSPHAGEEWTFSRPGQGYVYCDCGRPNYSGTLGKQICKGGSFGGYTVSATDETFEKTVKKWMADYRRNLRSARGG